MLKVSPVKLSNNSYAYVTLKLNVLQSETVFVTIPVPLIVASLVAVKLPVSSLYSKFTSLEVNSTFVGLYPFIVGIVPSNTAFFNIKSSFVSLVLTLKFNVIFSLFVFVKSSIFCVPV